MYKTQNDHKSAERNALNREILERFPKDVFRLHYENALSNCENSKTQLTKIPKSTLLSIKEAVDGYKIDVERLGIAEDHLHICGRLKLGIPIPKNYCDKSSILTVYEALKGELQCIQELKKSCMLFILYNPEGLFNYVDADGHITSNEMIWAHEYYELSRRYPNPVRIPHRIAKILKF